MELSILRVFSLFLISLQSTLNAWVYSICILTKFLCTITLNINHYNITQTLPPTLPTPSPTTSSPTPPTTAYPTAQTICIDEDALDWRSYDNEIKLNGNRFNLKGLSWFGFETVNDYVYGTDIHSVDWYLDWIVDNV